MQCTHNATTLPRAQRAVLHLCLTDEFNSLLVMVVWQGQLHGGMLDQFAVLEQSPPSNPYHLVQKFLVLGTNSGSSESWMM